MRTIQLATVTVALFTAATAVGVPLIAAWPGASLAALIPFGWVR